MSEKIKSYKAFNKDWTCRGFQFEVGKEYKNESGALACNYGFHACEYPLDVFNYYAPYESVFAEVEQGGEISKEVGDTKVASSFISIKAELNIRDLVNAAFEFTYEKCKKLKSSHSAKNQSASSATGDQSASSATGYQSASSATGYQSASSATGDQSASSATGDKSASSATGYKSASSATGYQSASSATGHKSASSATGYQSASSATGDQSASSATGYQSASSATGDQSASSATGYKSASSATGGGSVSLSTGNSSSSEIIDTNKKQNAVAIAAGKSGRAKAPTGSAIVCVYRGDNGCLIHIKSSLVGENGIKPNVWYSLNEIGNFIEV